MRIRLVLFGHLLLACRGTVNADYRDAQIRDAALLTGDAGNDDTWRSEAEGSDQGFGATTQNNRDAGSREVGSGSDEGSRGDRESNGNTTVPASGDTVTSFVTTDTFTANSDDSEDSVPTVNSDDIGVSDDATSEPADSDTSDQPDPDTDESDANDQASDETNGESSDVTNEDTTEDDLTDSDDESDASDTDETDESGSVDSDTSDDEPSSDEDDTNSTQDQSSSEEPPDPDLVAPPIRASTLSESLEDSQLLPFASTLAAADQIAHVPLMRSFETSLGECSACHEADYAVWTEQKFVSLHMWEKFVVELQFKDGGLLYCDSCHQGQARFLDRTDPAAVEVWMQVNLVDKLERVDGQPHGCETCHGDPPVYDLIALWSASD